MSENASHSSQQASSDATDLAPISESKRIDSMDILRGVALVGILLMNIEWFGRSIADIGGFDRSLTGLDHAVGWLVRCFVEGKFYKLFALLFGMGFAVMLIRARERGLPFRAWFVRRMLVLFIIGMLHMILVWPGDILHDYAFAGLLLLGWILLFQSERMKRFDNPGTFLRIGLIWATFPVMASTIAGGVFGVQFDDSRFVASWQEEQHIAAMIDERMAQPDLDDEGDSDDLVDEFSDEPTNESTEDRELTREEEIEKTVADSVKQRRERDRDIDKELAAYTTATYWEATKHRAADSLSRLRNTPFFAFFVLMPTFLIGYWMVASGVLRNHRENRHIFKPMAIIGLTFGLFFTVGGLVTLQHPAAEISEVLGAAGGTLFFFGQYVLCAGYVGLIVLLLDRPRWFTFLNRFAPMGRMALTNYIMQTVILAAIFHGYAGGLFGQVSRAPQMLIALAILVFQMIFSIWWLQQYRFGPLEWIWRSLTYKSIQPIKR